jgi:hypothetical protein
MGLTSYNTFSVFYQIQTIKSIQNNKFINRNYSKKCVNKTTEFTTTKKQRPNETPDFTDLHRFIKSYKKSLQHIAGAWRIKR